MNTFFHKHSTLAAAALALLLPIAQLASTAPAQSCTVAGAFQPYSPAYRGAGGSTGIQISALSIFIDTDRDGGTGPSDTGDMSFPLPVGMQGSNQPINMALSPSQQFLFTAGGQADLNSGFCNTAANRLRIYRVPATAGQPLTLIVDDCLNCPPLNGSRPVWYDAGITPGGDAGQPPMPNALPISTRRFAVVNTSPSNCGSPNAQPQLRFYNLVTGAKSIYTTGLAPGTGILNVSPAGDFMVVQHDLTLNPAHNDIEVLNLCNLSAIFSIETGFPSVMDNVTFNPFFTRVASSTSSNVNIEITDGGNVAWSATVPCCSTGGAPGACCVVNTCSITTAADCAAQGGVFSANTTCNQISCGAAAAALDPVMSPPVSIAVNTPFTVPVSVTNTGGTVANNVRLVFVWPHSSIITFNSASNGGTANGSVVTWTIPSVAPGATVNRTVSLTSTCWTGPQALSIQASADFVPLAERDASLNVDTLVTGPVTVTVASVPSVSPPLILGDTINHTITLTNLAAFRQENLFLVGSSNGITAGNNAAFDGSQTATVGTLTVVNTSQVTWTGALDAGQTSTISLRTQITDCYQPGFFSRTALGGGTFIQVQAPCSKVVGQSASSTTQFQLRPPVIGTLRATNIQAGLIGPANTSAASAAGNTFQPVRALSNGSLPELRMLATFTNQTTSAINPAILIVPIAFNWTLSQPPTNGAVYDSNTRIITLTTVLAAGASASFEFSVVPPPRATLSQSPSLSLRRTTPICLTSLGGFTPQVVPPLPSTPFVLSLNNFFGGPISILTRNVNNESLAFIISGDRFYGMDVSAANDTWYAGTTVSRFNYETLDSDTYPEAVAFAIANGGADAVIRDVVFHDPSGDAVLFAQAPGAATGILFRMNRSSHVCTLLANDAPATITELNECKLSLDAGGDIILSNHDQLYRYPGNATSQLPPNSGQQIVIPGPSYSIPDSGTQAAQRVWAHAPLCDGTWAVLHATEFDNPAGLAFITGVRLFALSRFDPASSSLTIIDSQFAAAIRYSSSWSIGGDASPTFTVTNPAPIEVSTASLIEAEPGELMYGTNSYPAFAISAVNMNTGALTHLQTPFGFQFRAAVDLAYYQPASTTCPTGTVCIGDYNQDGGVDGSDVTDFFIGWSAADPAADVNQDGGIDGSDVTDFFVAWSNGC